MPKWLHNKLARAGKKSGLSGDRLQAYVHSTLRKHKMKKRRKKKKRRRVARP
jgi:hypothetical protein